MPGGLVALLDDVSIIARTAAASVDDIAAAAGRAGSKTAGVVIDDAAVTPSYVSGLSPARELPIIWNITKGSLINKLAIILPGALLLSEFLPQAIVFILMLGGAYLSYEGAEKVLEYLGGEKHGKTLDDEIEDPVAFEKQRIAGAIRTDLILSAEIMAITLNEVASETLLTRAGVLALVGIGVTLGVYGVVALIVKMDDIGLHLAKEARTSTGRNFGRFLVRAMPRLLVALSAIGTVAMLWVGGGIILHGLAGIGVSGPEHLVEGIEHGVSAIAGGALGWLSFASLSALLGLVLGTVIVFVLHKVFRLGH
ncbi:MAG: ABC transporter [Sphingomonadales bacterium 32-64-17]|nr:MAG: ABC transporter [Sphingomonadales bacterium 32-64-17]